MLCSYHHQTTFIMSKIKILTIAVIGLLIINLGVVGFLFMQKPPAREDHGRVPPEERPKMIIIERLHFDRGQVAQYEQFIDQLRRSIRELDEQMRKTKNDLYSTLIDGSSATKDSIETKLGQIQKKIEETHYNHFADIKKLCKPDQLKYFNDLTTDLARFFAPGKNLPTPPKD